MEHTSPAGLAAVMFMLATGLLVGPAPAGVAAASFGLPAALAEAAVVIAAAIFLTPREELRHSPAAA